MNNQSQRSRKQFYSYISLPLFVGMLCSSFALYASFPERIKLYQTALEIVNKEGGQAAIPLYQKLIDKYPDEQKDSIYALACHDLFTIYIDDLGDLTKAAAYNQLLLKTSQANKHTISLLLAYNNQHLLELYRGNFVKSLEELEHFRIILENSGVALAPKTVKRKYLSYHINRSNIFIKLGEIDLAIDALQEGVSCFDSHTKPWAKTKTYLNLAAAYRETKPDSVIHYCNKVLPYCNQSQFVFACNLTYNLMAYAEVQKKNYAAALSLVRSKISVDSTLSKDNNVNTMKGAVLYTIGHIYAKNQEYQNAIKCLKKALLISKEADDLKTVDQVLLELAQIHEQLGAYKMALKFWNQKSVLQKQLANQLLEQKIQQYERRKLLKDKNLLIANLTKEKQELANNSNWLFKITRGLLILLLLGGIIFLAWYIKNKLEKHRLNEEIGVAKMKGLTTNINAHFLFNSFNTLQNFILKGEKWKATEYLTNLSDIIRKLLVNSQQFVIPFSQELDLLKNYIKLEEERFNQKINFQLNIADQFSAKNLKVPAMLIQPHLENAIIHGLSNIDKQGNIDLSFEAKQDYFVCTITDNGIGRKAAGNKKKMGKHLSMASQNTNDRIDILKKMGYSKSQMIVKDLYDSAGKAKGTEVQLILPFMISQA